MNPLTILRGRSRDIGFTVRRLLPTLEYPAVGAFVFLDHMGPAQFPAGTTEGDVRPHPHIGLATVTYLYSGAFEHRDSLGVFQRIEPGAVNLMSAGRGVVHSERIPQDIRQRGVAVEGIQMWLALPLANERDEPYFHHYPAEELPLLQHDHVAVRVLMGAVNGMCSPVKAPAPILFTDVNFHGEGELALTADYPERALYVAQGQLQVLGQAVTAGELAILPPDCDIRLRSDDAARAMLLGGSPLDGKRFLWWNFVASDKALIEQAKTDWQADRFATVPGEHERIPLPER